MYENLIMWQYNKIFMLYDYNVVYTCFYEMFIKKTLEKEGLNNVLFMIRNIINYLELPKIGF